ncbi:MAG: sodium:solute symporter [Bacteroidetes bacterium]|nr:sodium:solute symporter [Bacteroidota bacterium]MBK7109202.1 sodium:solute symporter [Bacteroidota bacterium]MBK8488477.1 sodium:solute symporter [Bacteroidota bacterium]
MSAVDWLVMLGTLISIAAYGIYHTRGNKNLEGFIKADNTERWWGIGLSVMATQASAITFLSTPGQAYSDGMGFIQFYFGLPIAMILVAVFFIPMYYKLKVFTAYEFLEKRFDVKTRTLTAGLFLLQRSVAAGITIYAPSIIVSQLIGWSLNFTVIFIGTFVTGYVLSGGTKAVAITHKQQMAVIFTGMFVAFGFLVYYITRQMSFNDGLHVAGTLGKMNIVDYKFDLNNRYTIWSGILGGLFLQLSYFGTDQSQVGRYISGKSVAHSRLGLIFNGLMKIPMQFFILITGVLVFVFYQMYQPPVYFNTQEIENIKTSKYSAEFFDLNDKMESAFSNKSIALDNYVSALHAEEDVQIESEKSTLITTQTHYDSLRNELQLLVTKNNPKAEDDNDYIFMRFVMDFLPIGLVGLLFAVIFSAGMSSSASEINALAATFTIDIYKRLLIKNASPEKYLTASRILTLLFGLLAIGFALIVSQFENLIEAVNIIGSLFYGTILGIFLTALLLKSVSGNAVFIAALITQFIIFYIDFNDRFNWGLPSLHLSYLWYNVLGSLLVMLLSLIIQQVFTRRLFTNH